MADGDDQPSVDSFGFRPRYQRTATVPRQAAARMAQIAITAAVTALLWLPLSAIRAARPVIPAPIPAPAHAAWLLPECGICAGEHAVKLAPLRHVLIATLGHRHGPVLGQVSG